jgi:excisionase family DNA binding protein
MEPRTPSPGPVPKGSASPARRLLSLKEAAEVLGIGLYSVRRLIWTGKLPAVRILRRIQIDTKDLERLIERSKDRSVL